MRVEAIDADGRRATAEARERFAVWRAARAAVVDLKGSLNWVTSKGADYLVRSAYDAPGGRRRQTSLGRRSPATEAKKATFDGERIEAKRRLAEAERALERSQAVVRALRAGTLAPAAGRLLRGLDAQGVFEAGWRVVGPVALVAAAAAAGVGLVGENAAEVAVLGEAEQSLMLLVPAGEPPRRLLDRLTRIDRSVRRRRDGSYATAAGFRIETVVATAGGAVDRVTARTADLGWLWRLPASEAVAFDRSGAAVATVSVDLRATAAADLWLAGDLFRDAERRRRDRILAEAALLVAAIAAPATAIRGVPREVIAAVGPIWAR